MNYNTGTLLAIVMPVTGLILNQLPYRPIIYMEKKKWPRQFFSLSTSLLLSLCLNTFKKQNRKEKSSMWITAVILMRLFCLSVSEKHANIDKRKWCALWHTTDGLYRIPSVTATLQFILFFPWIAEYKNRMLGLCTLNKTHNPQHVTFTATFPATEAYYTCLTTHIKRLYEVK